MQNVKKRMMWLIMFASIVACVWLGYNLYWQQYTNNAMTQTINGIEFVKIQQAKRIVVKEKELKHALKLLGEKPKEKIVVQIKEKFVQGEQVNNIIYFNGTGSLNLDTLQLHLITKPITIYGTGNYYVSPDSDVIIQAQAVQHNKKKIKGYIGINSNLKLTIGLGKEQGILSILLTGSSEQIALYIGMGIF